MAKSVANNRRIGSAADLPDRTVTLALSQARASRIHSERNTALLLTSLTLGLRAGEMSSLTWSMVLDDHQEIGRVLKLPDEVAKWRSGAQLPMSKQLQAALQALYAAQSLKAKIAPADPIFRSQKGLGLTRQSVVDLFRLIWARAGVNASSHSGRRYFITKAARGVSAVGGSLRDVMALARHKHMSTTQLYVQQNTKAQIELVDLVSRGVK